MKKSANEKHNKVQYSIESSIGLRVVSTWHGMIGHCSNEMIGLNRITSIDQNEHNHDPFIHYPTR